ncbi:MAG: hypothetical protein MRK02_13775 [Candidatus Scalindua sp.]|nr:hypothetical protein [Candidatus Scalindua sp.]
MKKNLNKFFVMVGILTVLVIGLKSNAVFSQATTGGGAIQTENLPTNVVTTQDIPFRVIRALLPQDGNVISHTVRKNVWTQNQVPFFRNETVEFSFGRGIRANIGDRKNERWLGEGIVIRNGYLELNAGWRAHIQVPVHDDFFDGTIRARLALLVDYGRIHVAVDNIELSWNSSFGADLVTGLTFGTVNVKQIVEKKLREEITRGLNDKISHELNSRMESLKSQFPLIPTALSYLSLRILPDKVRLYVHGLRDRLVFVQLPSGDYFKPNHTHGDKDFNGNGPRFQSHIHFFVSGNHVYRKIYVFAKETKSDWTTASGWSEERLVYSAPPGYRIETLGVTRTFNRIVDRTLSGHGSHELDSAFGPVYLYGDHGGDDTGVYTALTMKNYTYRLPVVLKRDLTNTRQTVQANLTPVFYKPPHTNGDRDFNGHGPNMNLNISLARTSTQVKLQMYLKARETKGDLTTAAGTYEKVIYRVPDGYRITNILGKTSWPNLVNYEDKDHSINIFFTPLGLMNMYGDRSGNDAGIYTGVLALFNYAVPIEIERIY